MLRITIEDSSSNLCPIRCCSGERKVPYDPGIESWTLFSSVVLILANRNLGIRLSIILYSSRRA